MSDPFAHLLEGLVQDLSAAAEKQAAQAAPRRQQQAEADRLLPWAYKVDGTLVADAAARGWPISGPFRAWEGNGFAGPPTIKPFDIWTRECPDCGGPFILLRTAGEKTFGRGGVTRCQGCQQKAVQDQWKRYKRRQRNHQPKQVACAHCGEEFTAKRSTATFCSTKCRVASHRASPAAAVVKAVEPAVEPAAPKNKGAEGKVTGPLGSQVKMDPTPTLAEQGVSKPVPAPPKAVREWIASSAIDWAKAQREDALHEGTDPLDATTARHEATAMELLAQKLRHPRQRWEFHGVEEGWLECRLHDALGDAEVCAAEGNIKGEAKALSEAAGYRAVAAWLGIELQNLRPSQTGASD